MDCELCKSREFKYTCPRCNIKYCSLDCYRSENHSQCSEAFYKECIVNELKEQHSTTEDQKKVLEMLKKVEAEDDEEPEWEDIDSDDSDEGDLADRLDGVDLNNADAVWDKLTPAEKEEFKSIVYNGEIEKIVQPVEPWWKQRLEDKPVVDIEEQKIKLAKMMELCPSILQSIKDFSKISTKKPADCIVYNISNILGTYCYIFRFYNGDHHSYALEATNNFISICNNLKANTNFDNVMSAIDSIVLNCHNFNLFADLNTKDVLLDDIRDLFNSPSNDFLLSALSDVIRLFELSRHRLREIRGNKSKKKKGFSSEFAAPEEENKTYPELENQTHFTGCVKKLEFYLSYIRHSFKGTEIL